jgi:secernin
MSLLPHFSCDSCAAVGPAVSGGGGVIFGKNSDRDRNEAQNLEFHPPGTHEAARERKLTYISVPDRPETGSSHKSEALRRHAVLLSRPFWMFGAEMGVNDVGVAIGNE